MAIEPTRREMQARYDLATEWHRKQCPITQEGEELLAECQRMEERHSIERRQWEAKYARYLSQAIRPLEYRRKAQEKATPPRQEQEVA